MDLCNVQKHVLISALYSSNIHCVTFTDIRFNTLQDMSLSSQ